MTQGKYHWTHRKVEKARGLAKDHLCVDCGNPAMHWSLNEALVTNGPVIASKDDGKGLYAPNDLQAYEPRCRSCHGVKDRAADPEWAEASRVNALRGSQRNAELIASDPARAEQALDNMLAAQQEHVRRVKTDPNYAANALKGFTAGRAMRRKCIDCGLVSNPGSLGRHLAISGHGGYTNA